MRDLLIITIMLCLTGHVFAKDFGQKGKVYPIVEVNLLEHIYKKLNKYNSEGRIDELQKEFAEKVKKSIERPSGNNIPSAIKNRTWTYDPSLELTQNIYNDKSEVIARSGDKVNPLQHVTLTKELIFINADIEKQINFAKKKINQNQANKIILVNGSISDTNQKLNKGVYFDQEAKLIQRFGISRTPAVVKQEGTVLRVSEVAL